jgi:hypothetical protein
MWWVTFCTLSKISALARKKLSDRVFETLEYILDKTDFFSPVVIRNLSFIVTTCDRITAFV